MSTDEFSTEVELYGVSPGVIAVIMFVVSLIVPLGFIATGPGMPIFLIMALFYPIIFLPLTILNILYVVWIVRYYQAKASKNSVLMLGLLSIILPTVFALYITGLFGEFMVIYPIPIQFIAGLLILWRIEGPEVISPWSGMRLNLSCGRGISQRGRVTGTHLKKRKKH